jgi:hypothetical protein
MSLNSFPLPHLVFPKQSRQGLSNDKPIVPGRGGKELEDGKADTGLGQIFVNTEMSRNARLPLTLTVLWK